MLEEARVKFVDVRPEVCACGKLDCKKEQFSYSGVWATVHVSGPAHCKSFVSKGRQDGCWKEFRTAKDAARWAGWD